MDSTDKAPAGTEPKKHHPAPLFRHLNGGVKMSPLKLKISKIKKNTKDFFLDHPGINLASEQVYMIVLEFISAFIFAYGYRAFIAPSRVPWDIIQNLGLEYDGATLTEATYNSLDLAIAAGLVSPTHLVSGGASGISQVLTRICELCGLISVPEKTLQSLFYFLVNVPIIILGFIKVGKKFTFYSLLNVLFTSILIDAIPQSWCEIVNIYEDNVARALAGGLTTGLSSGMALAAGTSTGGVDILSIYVAERKSTTVGKYSLFINGITVITFTVLCFFPAGSDPAGVSAFDHGAQQTTMSLYTIIYFFLQSRFVDALNTKNKKTELQVFTSKAIMSKVLIHGFPHACTVLDARGGFSDNPLTVIYIVVSNSEVKKAVRVMRTVDPNCFISVISTKQVYGKFYVKPID